MQYAFARRNVIYKNQKQFSALDKAQRVDKSSKVNQQ